MIERVARVFQSRESFLPALDAVRKGPKRPLEKELIEVRMEGQTVWAQTVAPFWKVLAEYFGVIIPRPRVKSRINRKMEKARSIAHSKSSLVEEHITEASRNRPLETPKLSFK